MAGESFIPEVSTEGDKKFQKEMEQHLTIDVEVAKVEGQKKTWEKVLKKIDDSVQDDKVFRDVIRKATDNPELSEELRKHLRSLVEKADARDKALVDSRGERALMAQKLSAQKEQTPEKSSVDQGKPAEIQPVTPEIAKEYEKLGISPQQIEKFVEGLMKEKDWKKQLIREMSKPEVMMKIIQIEDDKDKKLKLPQEFRDFVDSLMKASEKIAAGAKEYTQKNLIRSFDEARSFADVILKNPAWEETLQKHLEASRTYRIKFSIAIMTLLLGLKGSSSPDAQKDAEKYHKAFDKYVLSSDKLAQELVADMGLDEKSLAGKFGPEFAEFLGGQIQNGLPKVPGADSKGAKSEGGAGGGGGVNPEKKTGAKPGFVVTDGSDPAKTTDTAGKKSDSNGSKPGESVSGKKKELEGVLTPADVQNMTMGQLLSELIESLSKLSDGFHNIFSAGEKKDAATKAVEKFSEDELAKVVLDLQKEKDKVYPNQEAATEYVCTVLNLPLRSSPKSLLETFKLSGLLLEQDLDKKSEMKVGDVIFFQKFSAPGDAAYVAVISNTEPFRIKTVPENGGKPQEMLLDQSTLYKNGWLGFVKLPRKDGQSAPASLQKP